MGEVSSFPQERRVGHLWLLEEALRSWVSSGQSEPSEKVMTEVSHAHARPHV